MSDAELMAAIRERDTGAFETLAARYRELLARHLQSMVRESNTSADLLQEALLRVWTHADQWEERGSVRAWLFRIATNLALNHLRAQRRRREQPLLLPPLLSDQEEDDSFLPSWMIDTVSLGPEEQAARNERHALLYQLIAALPAEKRDVMLLVHDADLDLRTVAAHLSIPEGTVKSRLHHARTQLARQWHDFDAEEDHL